MDEILKMFGGAENIWAAIQQNATKVGIETTHLMLELFYVLKSPETGMLDKTLIVAALGYQLLPKDAMPRDRFGLLGLLDNGITLAFAYNRVKASVTPEVERQVNNILVNWFGTSTTEPQLDCATADNTPKDNGCFSQPPVFNTPGQQTIPSGNIPTRNNQHDTTPQKPIWNDEEEVVID